MEPKTTEGGRWMMCLRKKISKGRKGKAQALERTILAAVSDLGWYMVSAWTGYLKGKGVFLKLQGDQRQIARRLEIR